MTNYTTILGNLGKVDDFNNQLVVYLILFILAILICMMCYDMVKMCRRSAQARRERIRNGMNTP